MSIIFLIITVIYLLTIILLIWGFHKVPKLHVQETDRYETFTIVIPFRNEAENLPALLTSLSDLEYDPEQYELIFVDDASEDNSLTLIESFIDSHRDITTKLLSNSLTTGSPKKAAINLAVNSSTNDWILTTDADCQIPSKWLVEFNAMIQREKPDLIAGPVNYFSNSGWLDHFQSFDMLSLQFATIGGFGLNRPFLCNGANLAYRRSLFIEQNGFEDNAHISSGDDVFMLHAAVNKAYKVSYLKSENAIVWTQPQPTFKDLLEQRKRWAAKSTAYSNLMSKFVAFVVLLMNITIIAGIGLLIFGRLTTEVFLSVILLKFFADILSIRSAANFFNHKMCLQYFILGLLFYPLFVLIVCISALLTGFQWKGRHYSK